eukprot:3329917-Amphidinium_carterae.1
MVQQRDAVIGEANTSFTKLHEEYQSAQQARSHLIELIRSQEGDQYMQTLQQALAEHKLKAEELGAHLTAMQMTQMPSATHEWPAMSPNTEGVARLRFTPGEQLVSDQHPSP